ncbi:MAG: hypothetical protein COB66_01005 [Coxiella sp. (in: Bacteria)]|nr:MAG: hypothetical protein COB66_01005 [Coxiella sp. (in: g-proteobacteria)]
MLLGCNDQVAACWKLASTRDIKSKKHAYLARVRNMAQQCDSFLINNRQVVQSEQPLMDIYELGVPNGLVVEYFKTNLLPLQNKDHKTIGVFGISKRPPLSGSTNHIKNLSQYIENNSDFNSLTKRERHVLQFLAMGCTTKIVAARLQLSARTIETHVENLKTKMNVHSKAALVMSCFDID